jgi:hypothetical protein
MSSDSENLAALLPSSAPTDSESVRTCLDTAQALWEKGELREAVRMLQRGAAAAEEAGDDDRALSIARRAADLSTHVSPPSVRPAGEGSPDSVRRLGPDAMTPAAPGVARRAESAPPQRPQSSAPPPAAQRAEPSFPPPIVQRAPSNAPGSAQRAPSNAPASVRSAANVAPAGVPARATDGSVPAAGTSSVQGTLSPSELVADGRALRVAVKRSAVDGALYVVRPLHGKPVAGAREALLVLSDPDPTFFADLPKA